MKKFSKKILSSVLCLSVLLCVPISAKAKKSELKLAVAADTHFKSCSDTGNIPQRGDVKTDTSGMINGDMFYYASVQGQMNYESTAIVKQMLASFAESDDEYLLIAGDLTCGTRRSHKEFAELLRETEKKSGKEIFVICGNHDCVKERTETRTDIEEFTEIYSDFGYGQAVSRHDKSASYTADLSDEYRLIAIDSCIYGEDDGRIKDETASWIKEQSESAKKDGKTLIAMMHHSILPHFAVQPMTDRYSDRASLLAESGIELVFTGHIHANDISSADTKNGKIYDIQTGSLITSPNMFRHVSVGDETKISAEYITKIDVDDLPKGYSDAQLEMLKSDFPSYSKAFFEAGMYFWLNRYIGSAYKLGRLLKIDEDTAAYAELDSIMKEVGRSVNLPLYENGSAPDKADTLEEYAKLVGVTLPESNYDRIYQVVAALMANFYAGDTAQTRHDTELSLLIGCIEAAILHCTDSGIFGGRLSSLFTALRVPTNGTLTCAAQKLAVALVTPFADGICCDFSSPDDTDTVIATNGDNGNGKTAPLSFAQKIARWFNAFFSALKKMFAVSR